MLCFFSPLLSDLPEGMSESELVARGQSERGAVCFTLLAQRLAASVWPVSILQLRLPKSEAAPVNCSDLVLSRAEWKPDSVQDRHQRQRSLVCVPAGSICCWGRFQAGLLVQHRASPTPTEPWSCASWWHGKGHFFLQGSA